MHDRLVTLLWVTAAFLAGGVVAAATSSVVFGVVTLLAVLFASLAGRALLTR
jgi:hypothetical protein